MQARVLSGASAGCSGRFLEDTLQLGHRGHRGSRPFACRAQHNSANTDTGKYSDKRSRDRQTASAGTFQQPNTAGGAVGYGSTSLEDRPRRGDTSLSASQDSPQLFPAAEESRGVLAINVDLRLFHARQYRIRAFRQSNRKRRMEKLQKAEELFRECLSISPNDGRAYVSLARILMDQQRFDEAVKLYEDGVRMTEGRNAYMWCAWANYEAKKGNYRVARDMFDASTAVDPAHAAAWHGWGMMEKRTGNLLRARDVWLKGIRKTKEKPNPYLFQSVALLAADMGLVEEARKWFLKGTTTILGAESHAMWLSWALMEAEQGDDQAVRYLFKRCLEVAPRSRYLYLSWAKWELMNGNAVNARQLLNRGHALNMQDAALLQALGEMDAQAQKFDSASYFYKLASEAAPRDIYVWQGWGVMEYRRGNFDRARELLQEGVWADSGSKNVAYVWQAWGVLEAKAGNHELARQLFKCAIKADAQNDIGWLSWARMEEGLGYLLRASELRSRSLEERTTLVQPRNFADPDQVLRPMEPIVKQISRWLELFEARTLPRPLPKSTTPGMLSGYLPPDDASSEDLASRLKPKQERTIESRVSELLEPREAEQMAAWAAADRFDIPMPGYKPRPVPRQRGQSSV